MTSRQDARREIAIFLALTLVSSGFFYAFLFRADTPYWSSSLAAAFMWCPGAAAIVTRLVLYRSVRGLGWGWGRTTRYLAGVILAPFVLALPVYLVVWLFGLGGFSTGRLAEAASRMGIAGLRPGLLLVLALLAAPAGAILGSVSTLGEELGWRGLLVPALSQLFGRTTTSLVTGAVWAAWHYPLVLELLPRYRPQIPVWYALLCFTVSVIGVSFFYTWLRLASASLWPCVLLHASSNAAQETFEGLTIDTGPTYYLTYEYGAGFTVVISLLLLFSWKGLRGGGPGDVTAPRTVRQP